MKAGLLGRKLGHSFSPQIHSCLGNYPYQLFEIEPEELEQFLLHGDYDAINVTIPYKKAVLPYCNLTPTAEKLGSVNTIVRQPDGSLLGHNTDYYGFQSMLNHYSVKPMGKKCLVLGSGGASVTASAVLRELGGDVIVISRSGENNYQNLVLHRDAAIICNCTPVGMYPNNGETPINLNQFSHLEFVVDLIYNPGKTALLLDAEKRNIPCCNGLWMLVAQAKEASERFQNITFPEKSIEHIYQKLRQQIENIILIGMPGCGKSTLGKMLANALGKTFIDADEALVNAYGVTIPEIFAREGEEDFRKKETTILADLGKRSGHVIATGGGCVTREENYPLLHQNGIIIALERNISKLPTQGRPLSQSNSLEIMYNTRLPLYRQFADYAVDNNGTPEQTLAAILKLLEEIT